MTEEQIIEIIKLEAHKNLTIVDVGTDSYNDYVIRGVDLMAQELVKLLSIHNVVHRRELLLAAICEYNKYNTQKDIKAVDDWLKDWDSK